MIFPKKIIFVILTRLRNVVTYFIKLLVMARSLSSSPFESVTGAVIGIAISR